MMRYLNQIEQLKQSHLALAKDARHAVETKTVGSNIHVMLFAAIAMMFALTLPYVGEVVSLFAAAVFIAGFVRMFAYMAFYSYCSRA